MITNQKSAILKAEVMSQASAALLQTAINDFFVASSERILVDVQFTVDGGTFAALILYTE